MLANVQNTHKGGRELPKRTSQLLAYDDLRTFESAGRKGVLSTARRSSTGTETLLQKRVNDDGDFKLT